MVPTPPHRDQSEPEEPEFQQPSSESGEGDDLVTVATFRAAPEAELAKTALDAEGIEAFIADAETVTMDWLLGIAIGDVKIQVARSVAERAREILARRRHPDESAEPPGVTTCLSCGTPFSDQADRCPKCGWSFEGE